MTGDDDYAARAEHYTTALAKAERITADAQRALAEAIAESERIRAEARSHRAQLVADMRTAGRTWKQIGQTLGVSQQGASDFARRHGIV